MNSPPSHSLHAKAILTRGTGSQALVRATLLDAETMPSLFTLRAAIIPFLVAATNKQSGTIARDLPAFIRADLAKVAISERAISRRKAQADRALCHPS